MPATKRAGRTAANASSTADTTTTTAAAGMTSAARRTSPFIPTPVERLALGLFPLLLVFGSLFALLSPDTRALTYDAATQSHRAADGSLAPSYFARKSNLFNVYFVKRGWGWTTAALLVFVFCHPAVAASRARARALARWAVLTTWWALVTQWCWGAPLIDRGFRWTGGQCDVAALEVVAGTADAAEVLTAVACKAVGGRWRGGHDISGHVFLLTLGSALLMHEVLWPLARWAGWRAEERCVVMSDGALKGAGVEADRAQDVAAGREAKPVLGYAGKFALGVLGLNLWMLLMTAIYFHTWFEKFTGLFTAYIAIYAVYIVPRFVPALRQLIGVPGI
ncbi:hypothetical protein BB8028_0003g15090 [Beauveria bassiana]|uniref:Acyl-coenzyme A diphosphatase SCS3 n=1 Tax=Beauveria bassiana TaxID=176275 RepID=A0A2S7YA44_BEABA|nr:hypothetical protein BB8028_0003g15090 [Beauveria bassiana]